MVVPIGTVVQGIIGNRIKCQCSAQRRKNIWHVGRVIGKDNSQSTITVHFDENGVDETYRLPADLNRGRGRLRLTLPEEEKPHVVYKNGVHRSGVE